MRTRDVLLSVVFVAAISIGPGVTVGATSAMEFAIARGCFITGAVAMGIVFALWWIGNRNKPLVGRGWKIFVSAIVVLTITGSLAGLYWVNLKERAPSLEVEIAHNLLGGDNYCYILADVNAPHDSDGGFPILVENSGAVIAHVSAWIFPPGASKDIYSSEYKDGPFKKLSIALSRSISPCHAVGYVLYGSSIKPGNYEIEFSGSNNKNWNEILEIVDDEREVSTTVTIVMDAETIFHHSWAKTK
jgi:hypothetical protein